LCSEELPDIETLSILIADAKQVYGSLEFLGFYGEDDKILIVNNYTSLGMALADFRN
jgi:putative methionine-R-sulfoxide reductase with GAF domain